MLKKTLIACLIAVGLLGSLELLARRAGAQPAGDEGPQLLPPDADGPEEHSRRHPVRLTDEQEAELLAALKQQDEGWYERLMRVKSEHPRRYHFFLAKAWDFYQKVRDMPQELQAALKQMREDRVTSWRLVQKYRSAETSDQRERIRKELARTVGRLLDAEQKLTAYRVSQLEEQIRQVKARMEAQAKQRDKLIEERIEQLLTTPEPPRRPGPGMGRRRERRR